jgi:putative sigma-54 modulation protein
MQVIIKTKNLETTDRLRNYVETKVGKLDRYLPTIHEARVELSTETTRSAQDRQVCQITLRSNGAILRAEERSPDMFASIDAVLSKIHRQIARYKGKRQNRWRAASAAPELMDLDEDLEEDVEDLEEEGGVIVRVKRFRTVPMSSGEAIEQMELLGHDFFVFYNAETAGLNVVYRRRDGNYGLLEPEVI